MPAVLEEEELVQPEEALADVAAPFDNERLPKPKVFNPWIIALVVTIGSDAETYLAPAAKKQGCTVKTFASPYEAGNFVASKLKKGAVILAKGSQNRVFAEESLKSLLANPDDSSKLVRQSSYWLQRKRDQFNA